MPRTGHILASPSYNKKGQLKSGFQGFGGKISIDVGFRHSALCGQVHDFGELLISLALLFNFTVLLAMSAPPTESKPAAAPQKRAPTAGPTVPAAAKKKVRLAQHHSFFY